MYFRTYFDKDTIIVKDQLTNYGSSSIAELHFGGSYERPTYSRYLFHFSVDRLKQLYQNCQLGNLSQTTHRLVLKPTRFFGNCQKNKELCLDTSYNLCLFPINQEWEEGCGTDASCNCSSCYGGLNSNCNLSNGAANWFYAKSNDLWNVEGVYDTFSGDTVYLQCKAQSCNDCMFEMDVTSLVNDLITGTTENFGYGLAYNNFYEINPQGNSRHLGFYSKETDTFFQPYLETEYLNPIQDDRHSFYTDKENSLYLYVNLKGEPTNLDQNPIVTILNEFDDVYTTLTGQCVSLGVYEVHFTVPPTGTTDCTVWKDVWSNIRLNGILRNPIEQEFQLKSDLDYYNIGSEIYSPKEYGFKFRGIKRNEYIKRGDVRKIAVDVYELFKTGRKVTVDKLFYRIYVKEGLEQLEIVKWSPLNIANCENFFYLYTEWMLPQHYYIDFKAVSNQEERTYGEEIKFIIQNSVNC